MNLTTSGTKPKTEQSLPLGEKPVITKTEKPKELVFDFKKSKEVVLEDLADELFHNLN